MGTPEALARRLTTNICAASVTASMSGMEAADAATLAPIAVAKPISATRVRRSPPHPTPIVVQEARSHNSPPRMKSSMVRPRITPNPVDAAALRMSSAVEAAVSA